ncbi:SWI/SNF complex component SNF12 homolog [Quercus suber]|uniref:Upstream activation factor subunit spp27 n=1 Tax=Quercus suber TaxID=58331 RepID=A0AAW0LHT3_QUESU|nr:SWI/SNF complex component SNF12 homolog [Quercus suber]POE98876.1 upstream activation factor subunit spp27 [Quercus suber]
MATSLRLFPSFSSVSLMPKSSPTLMLYCSPANLRTVRTVTSATVSSNEAPQKRAPRGIMKPRPVSPEMQDLVGVPEISRTQALKQIWAHIKEHNLQDPENKRIIVCDDKLKKIFGGRERIGFLEIAGLISPHFIK